MFYRPHFCCHCGEKIVRAKWTPLTSRRFCDFCAIEQKQHDLLPRAAAVAVLLFGAAGLTAYLGGGDSPPAPSLNAAAKIRELKSEPVTNSATLNPVNSGRANLSEPAAINSSGSISNVASSNTKQRGIQRNSSTETVYYCGAMTKKGTPCTRRVKTPGRCWQHVGQPAMPSLQN